MFLAEPTPAGKAWRNKLPLSINWAMQVGNLQEKVENLAGDRMGGVSVFQVEPPVLLDIEAFILDFPAYTSSLVG